MSKRFPGCLEPTIQIYLTVTETMDQELEKAARLLDRHFLTQRRTTRQDVVRWAVTNLLNELDSDGAEILCERLRARAEDDDKTPQN